jgi:hypothetical protein
VKHLLNLQDHFVKVSKQQSVMDLLDPLLLVEIIRLTSLLQQDQLETTETKLMTPAQLVNDQSVCPLPFLFMFFLCFCFIGFTDLSNVL